jgi:hypothetical protein
MTLFDAKGRDFVGPGHGGWNSVKRWLRSTTMLSGILGGIALASGASAADNLLIPKAPELKLQPAVDGLNFKADAYGGTYARRSYGGVRGSATIPLADRWGAQLDLQGGTFGGRGFVSGSGHWFWRDPAQGLIGLYAAHTHWRNFGGLHVTHVAGEGEVYWDRWTLQGIAGVEFGNSAFQTTTTANLSVIVTPIPGGTQTTFFNNVSTFTEGFDVKTRFFDQINLKYYFTDNFLGFLGHRYLGGKHALALGAEYAMPFGEGRMASFFLEGRVGEGDYQGAWGGVRFYFGKRDKPLMQRHRQDDPIVWDTLFSIVNNYSNSSSSSSSSSTTQNCEFGPSTGTPGACETFD